MTRPRTVADRLARLTPQQRAALQRRLRAGEENPATEPDLTRRTGDRSVSPLGLDQERIWILDQLDPGRHTYNISTGLRFEGAFDEEAFREAVATLIRRHELLRSRVEVHEGLPVLRVSDGFETPVEFLDLRAEPDRVEETVRTLVRRPFDLAAGGLLRIVVVRAADDDHQVIETMHHSVTDQWSFVRLNRELLEHYRAIREGRPSRAPELPVQYGDFAVWQRRHFTGARRQAERDFWRTYLDGVPPHLPLPYDAPPQDGGHDGRHHYFRLDDELSAAFLAMCRTRRLTLSDALLAVYVGLLYEETGSRDIVVGLPSATRGRPETHDLIGFLLTNVPLRAELPADPTPTLILRAVRQASAAVADHREVPFSEIVDAVSPTRSLDRYPLLQTMHLVLDFDDTVVQVPDAEVHGVEVEDGVSPMDITVGWWRAGERLYGRFEYRTELFTAATVDRLVSRLLELVRVFVERPGEPLRARAAVPAPAPVATAAPPAAGPAGPPPAELRRITEVWREVLGTEPGPDDNFFECGGTSLTAIRLSHALRRAGFALTARQVFRAPTMRGQLALARPGQADAPDGGPRPEGAVSPEQEDLLEGGLPHPELWAHSLVLTAGRPMDPEWLRVVLKRVAAAHPGLGSTFRRTGTGWRSDATDSRLWSVEEPGADPARVAAAHRAAFTLRDGPLFAASLIPGRPDRIVLTAHHLVVDGLSWQILVDDLDRAYRGARPIAETSHPSVYAAAWRDHDVRGQRDYWHRQVEGIVPLGCRTGRPDRLGGETTHRVRAAIPPGADAAHRPAEALTALARAARPWFGGGDVVLDLIGPGRELPPVDGWDPARAVGFYATAHPVRLALGDDPGHHLRQVGRALDAVPDGGNGYLALRWSADPAVRRSVAGWGRAELSFNYLGALLTGRPDADDEPLFTVAEQIGPSGNDDATRYHAVAVLFEYDGEEAVFTWKFNPDAVDGAAVRAVAATAAEEFTRLARQGGSQQPSTTGMSLHEVNRMLAELTREKKSRSA
ncbi:condensation domain-containing protein [Streptomyces sp. NPDC012751]|uniref:condensation domain-containing protein n=1 Tax=Streptomyces sp. NPDC012751 TaxID=3364846 RepID=UPI0036A0AF78